MGGRNQRQQQCNNNNNGVQQRIATKIAALKVKLNIGALQIKVKIQFTSANRQQKDYPPGTTVTNEEDTNGETRVDGKHIIVLQYTVRSSDVYGYQKAQGPTKDAPIVIAATAWDCYTTGETFILIFNKFLWYGGDLDQSLHNPNQIRHNGLGLWNNPYDDAHELQIDIPFNNIAIPLQHRGTKLGFTLRNQRRNGAQKKIMRRRRRCHSRSISHEATKRYAGSRIDTSPKNESITGL